MLCTIYGMYALLILSTCAVGTVIIIIIIDAGPLAGAMASFPRTTCGFFPTLRVLYVWLAIHVDPTR